MTQDVRPALPPDPDAQHHVASVAAVSLAWGRVGSRRRRRRFDVTVAWDMVEVVLFGRYVGIYL